MFGGFIREAQKVPDKVKKAILAWRISRHYNWRVKAEFKNFRTALDTAQNPLMPDRRSLYAFYREVELDDEVTTQARTAYMTVQRAPFEVRRDKKASDELTDLFKRPWFFDLMHTAVMTEFWGHSLVEFNPAMADNGEFCSYWTLPRDQVRPEYGDVLTNQGDVTGVPYRDPKAFPFLLEMGRPDDLGLYHVVAIPALRKRFSDTDWSLFSERFGSPFLTIKTSSRDKKELDAKEEMAANFGSNGYAILDDQDTIEPIVANYNGTAHYTFRDRMEMADKQIAKLMNGQTGTSDEKSYVGSAEVHERILNDYTFSRLYRIQFWINFHLIPFLVRHGYKLEGCTFEFTELRKKEEKEASTDKADKPGESDDEKDKKLSAAIERALSVALGKVQTTPAAPSKKLAFQSHYDQYFKKEPCCT